MKSTLVTDGSLAATSAMVSLGDGAPKRRGLRGGVASPELPWLSPRSNCASRDIPLRPTRGEVE